MSDQRSYEGWWFVSNKLVVLDDSASQSSAEAVKETWIPLSTIDNDRLEQALSDPSFCDLSDAIVVHDETGQRLSKVLLRDMVMKPVYWEARGRPVRRAIWMNMVGVDDIKGGHPVPAEWDAVLEQAYQQHIDWIDSTTSGSVVEKLVELEEPLNEFVLVLRQGLPDSAKLTPKSKLGAKPSVFPTKDETIRLIRGYISYYIAVVSAIKSAEANGRMIEDAIVLSNPFDELILDRPRAPRSILFAVHGIGQKLAGRLGSDFINDCEALREQTKSAIVLRKGDINDLLILPVNWRTTLYMGITSYFPESKTDEESFENLVSMITLPNIPVIRDVASDVGLDILLYMTPAYFHRIIKATLNEIHRIYKLFLRAGGEGAENTKVSLLGHSLGAAIVSDLLSFIIKDESTEEIRKAAEAVICNLGFAVDCFFAVGSPLAMFFLLKQLKPLGCVANIHDINRNTAEGRGVYPSLPDPEDSTSLHPRKMMFASRQIYNIFHPYDPIAYRMEPLIIPPDDMIKFSYPLRLPYYKKGALHLKRQVQEQVQSFQEKAIKAKVDFVNSLPEWIKTRFGSPAKPLQSSSRDDPSKVKLSPSPSASSSPISISHPALTRFNHHGRIDFSVEESLLENSYLAAIRSHFSYWDDVDIASFLVVETISLPLRPVSPHNNS